MFEMYFHLFRGYYDLIDHIITPSDFYRRKLIEWRFKNTKVSHIPNFVDELTFSPNYEHDPYFLYFGRLSPEKGLLTLIEAMRAVNQATCIIAGTGPSLDDIHKKIETLQLSNVKTVGFKSGNDLKELIRNCMFFVLPSEWYENGPMSLLEAFASGKPVIGSSMGGIPENIDPGVDGLIFEAGNAGSLAEKIHQLINNKSQLSKMGRAARRKVQTKYSKVRHMEQLESLYLRLAGC